MHDSLLSTLAARAREFPHCEAIVGDEVVTYGELWRRVQVVASWLRDQSVARIALEGANCVAWVVADLAAWQAGIVTIPMAPFFSAAQRNHVLASAGVDGIVSCVADLGPSVEGLRLQRLPTARSKHALPDGVCKITFTSGTTGTPRGVCLDGRKLEAVTRALAHRIHTAPSLMASVDTHFTMLPLATLLENVAGIYLPLSLGKRIALHSGAAIGLTGSSGLDPAQLLRALHAARPNSLIVLPQILHALVAAAERGLRPPDSLRFIAVGGAKTPAALLHRALAAGLPVYEGYGLSECASVVALNAPGAIRMGSVGRPLDHVQVRVRDGAIEVAGNVFIGYLGQEATPRDGWLDTGDRGHFDEDGFLYVTGRRKNVLITGFGRNVSPEWIEGELALAPSVRDVLVLGDGRPRLAAIVVPTSGADAAQIAADLGRVNAALPDYARIGRFIVADEPFSPGNGLLTDNGRPRREAIADRYAESIDALYAESDVSPLPEIVHDLL